jgi:hypothetical protein
MTLKSHSDRHERAEAELMNSLLADPTADYPWDPADPETADYYAATDAEFSLDDWSDAEIADRSTSFFDRLHTCWDDVPAADNPLAAIKAKFGNRVPQQWLESIATNVSNLADRQLEPVDRLVASVGNLLANWATEDLQVMARPYAFAMRCETGVEDPDKIVRPLEWEQLSEIERAKLTILIAQYTIDEIHA